MASYKERGNKMDVITKAKLRNLFTNSRTSMVLAVTVAVVVVVAGLTVWRLQAMGFFVTAYANQASVSTNAKIISDSTAYGGKAIQFTEPVTPPPPPPNGNNCALPNYPTPNCTGVPTGVTPTPGGPCIVDTPGAVINGKTFACGSGPGLAIEAPNVTIRNSFIETGQYWGVIVRPGASLTIEDSTVGGTNGCSRNSAISGGDYTARRVKVTSGGDAFDVGFHPQRINRGNVLIEDSYAKLCAVPPAHADGLQSLNGGPNIVLNHNTIDMSFTDPAAQTAPVFWSDNSPYALTVTNNLLIAGSYTIRIHDGSGHIVNNNIVARNKLLYGPTLINVPVSQCKGNQLADVSPTYTLSNFSPLGCN